MKFLLPCLLALNLLACSNGQDSTDEIDPVPTADTLGTSETQRKIHPDEDLLASRLWELTELNGQPFDTTYAAGGETPYLTFNLEEGNVSGFSGCNSFGGKYELKEGFRLRFTDIFGTLKACMDSTVETSFMDMMHAVDNYNLSDTALVLNKAKMAPLARFRASNR